MANNLLTGHFTFFFMGHSYTQCALASCCIFNVSCSILALISTRSKSISGFQFFLWPSPRLCSWCSVAISTFYLPSWKAYEPVYIRENIHLLLQLTWLFNFLFLCTSKSFKYLILLTPITFDFNKISFYGGSYYATILVFLYQSKISEFVRPSMPMSHRHFIQASLPLFIVCSPL